MNTTINLNATDSATAVPEMLIVRIRRRLLGARRDTFVEVPGRGGSWVFPEEPGDRSIFVEFDLQGSAFSNLRDAVRRLATWADTLNGAKRFIASDEPDRFYDVVLVGSLDVDEWLLRGSGELEYRAGPYAQAVTPTTETFAASGAGSDSDTFAALDELVAYPVIEITPTNGTITALAFTMNGDTLDWSGLIADDETLSISSIANVVTAGESDDVNLTGAYDVSALSMSAVDGRFPLVIPGANAWSMTWTGSATTVTIEITWRRRYR